MLYSTSTIYIPHLNTSLLLADKANKRVNRPVDLDIRWYVMLYVHATLYPCTDGFPGRGHVFKTAKVSNPGFI